MEEGKAGSSTADCSKLLHTYGVIVVYHFSLLFRYTTLYSSHNIVYSIITYIYGVLHALLFSVL